LEESSKGYPEDYKHSYANPQEYRAYIYANRPAYKPILCMPCILTYVHRNSMYSIRVFVCHRH